MMRDYEQETRLRVEFIQTVVREANAQGIVYGNSGGKDSALVGILCKMACDNTLGVILPCQSRRNYDEDTKDALEVAEQYNIETITVDMTKVKEAIVGEISQQAELAPMALANINPRLRMTTLYAIAQSRSSLVAGTGNRSEVYTGYFTKWGDGAHDLNPIADLTVREIYEFLRYLKAPESVIVKEPSAALFEGQTDEKEMGFSYDALDTYLLEGTGEPDTVAKIERMHAASEHKRRGIARYGE